MYKNDIAVRKEVFLSEDYTKSLDLLDLEHTRSNCKIRIEITEYRRGQETYTKAKYFTQELVDRSKSAVDDRKNKLLSSLAKVSDSAYEKLTISIYLTETSENRVTDITEDDILDSVAYDMRTGGKRSSDLRIHTFVYKGIESELSTTPQVAEVRTIKATDYNLFPLLLSFSDVVRIKFKSTNVEDGTVTKKIATIVGDVIDRSYNVAVV